MSATIQGRDLRVTRGAQEVLAGVDVLVAPGQRLGVIGPNGVGKSTLLQVLAGLVRPDGGSVVLSPPGATVGYLPQEPDRREDETVLDFLARRTGVTDAQRRLDETTEALAAGAPGADDAYAEALERFLGLGCADLDVRAAQVLVELGLDAALCDRPTAALSGGQAARVSLASILLSQFDVMLLDEPTNDLDFEALGRLERFVRGAAATLVVISHDRAFLQAVITDVLEIDAHERTATLFRGGWEAFLEARRVSQRHAEENYAEYAARREDLQGRAQMQREWSRRGARMAKGDRGEKDKFVKAHSIATSEKMASKSRATERALERLEVVDKPWKHWELQLRIAEAPRSGEMVARLEAAVVRKGDFTLGPVDLLVRWRDRVAIVGPNGAGKTTLVEALLGKAPLASGAAWLGPGVVVGVLDQRRGGLPEDASLLEGFLEATGMELAEARTLLAKFGLLASHVARPVGDLSPGERTRACLALFQARAVNTLVLDEPTNHLDLPAIEQIEEALAAFGGTVLLISHDRRLLERFAATRTLALAEGAVEEQLP